MSLTTDFLKSLPYFADLSDGEVEQIKLETLEISLPRGEIFLLEGEPCQGLYVVKTGRVRIFKSSPDGREQVLLIAESGDSFNEVPVFDGGPNPASGSALESSVLYFIPKETLLSLVADCPAALAIIKTFAARLRHLTSIVEDLSFRNVVNRLAKLLLELAVVAEEGTPVPRLTQDEMAAMIGSVRDVVGRALRTLERSGAIQIKGQRITVISPEKLSDMIQTYDKSRMRED